MVVKTGYQITKLGAIARIMSGFPDKNLDRQRQIVNGIKYSFVQPNHLGDYNNIKQCTTIISSRVISEGYFLRPQDILVKRLNPDSPTLISQEFKNTIFSSNLFLIRVADQYAPTYIAAILEHYNQMWQNSNTIGKVTVPNTISQKALAGIEVVKLPWAEQNKIGAIWIMMKHRKKLLHDLLDEDAKLLLAILSNLNTKKKEKQ